MTNIFSAEPGTWLVNLDESVEPVPIIGWNAGQERCFPLFPMLRGGMKSGEAIRLPGSGAVVDPVWNRTFASEGVWREAFEDEEPYVPGKMPGVSGKDGKAPDVMKSEPNKPKRVEVTTEPARPGQVTWGTKEFKGNSWWCYDDGKELFIFEVPGEHVTPKDPNVKKITRKDFYDMRKTEVVKTVVPGDEPEDDDQDELPFEGEGEDDDMGGLV